MQRQETLVRCCCLALALLVMVADVHCRPSLHRHQDDNEEIFQLNGIVSEKEVLLENNKTDDAIKQFMQTMMNRPLGSKNMTGLALGGTAFNACVQSCSSLLSSVSDLHSCYRECLIDPYKYQASADTINLQLDISR